MCGALYIDSCFAKVLIATNFVRIRRESQFIIVRINSFEPALVTIPILQGKMVMTGVYDSR